MKCTNVTIKANTDIMDEDNENEAGKTDPYPSLLLKHARQNYQLQQKL